MLGRRWGLTEDKEDLGMLMLGVDTVLKLAVMKQTTHPLLTSLFVRARLPFNPHQVQGVFPSEMSTPAVGPFVSFIQGVPRAVFRSVRPTTYLRLMGSAVCVCTHCMPVSGQLDTAHPSRQVNDSEGIFQQRDSAPREVSRRVFGAERRNVTRSVVTVPGIECNSNYCSCVIGAAGGGGG